MRKSTAKSWPVSIFIAGDSNRAREICRTFCDEEGLCVTVTPTTYVYTGGEESGVIVGLINYPRFPSEPSSIEMTATLLALELMSKLEQESVSIQTPAETRWFSLRSADVAIALLDAMSEPLDCVGCWDDAPRITKEWAEGATKIAAQGMSPEGSKRECGSSASAPTSPVAESDAPTPCHPTTPSGKIDEN